jgi:acyl-CoA thioesterase
MNLSDQDRAEQSAAAMWAGDSASKYLGIELVSVGPGHAKMQMLVSADHCNGHSICHGGFIFTLADSCFAFACNSYNQAAVAQHNTISFVSAGKLGDILTAACSEVSRSGRSGVYDVLVRNAENQIIAVFRGCSRTIKGQNFQE